MKIEMAAAWADMSPEAQRAYLKIHPGSKRKVGGGKPASAKPQAGSSKPAASWPQGNASEAALRRAVPQLKHFTRSGPRPERTVQLNRGGSYKEAADPHHWMLASTHDGRGVPVTLPGHEAATGVAFKVNPAARHVHFAELNSHLRGAGRKMVDAVIAAHPGHTFSANDWSQGEGDTGPSFWERVRAAHPGKFEGAAVDKGTLHHYTSLEAAHSILHGDGFRLTTVKGTGSEHSLGRGPKGFIEHLNRRHDLDQPAEPKPVARLGCWERLGRDEQHKYLKEHRRSRLRETAGEPIRRKSNQTDLMTALLRTLAAEVAAADWWDGLSPKLRKAYLKAHSHSKFAEGVTQHDTGNRGTAAPYKLRNLAEKLRSKR